MRRVLLLMKSKIWIYFIAFFVQCLMYSGGQVIISFSNKYVANAALSKSMNIFLIAITLRIIQFVMMVAIYPICNYFVNVAVYRTLNDVKYNMFLHIQNLPKTFFDNNHSGDMISRITNDVGAIDNILINNIPDILDSIIWGIISTIGLLILDFRLALIIICLGFISTIISSRFSKPLGRLGEVIQKSVSRLNEHAADILSAVKVLKIFGNNGMFIKRYVYENNSLTSSYMKRTKINSLLKSSNELVGKLNFIGVLVIGVFMFKNGYTDIGTVIGVMTLQSGLSSMFFNMGSFYGKLKGSLAGVNRVFEILDMPIEPERYKLLQGEITNDMIAFKNVSFGYEPNETVVEGINLSAKKGKTIALVGASGNGKSTILKLLLGFYENISGNIILDGKSINEYTLQQIRGFMAYIPQDAYLFDGTIGENISLGKVGASRDEIIEATKLANAHEFINMLPKGYDTVVGEQGYKLSGGERQRIAIARALLKNAPILLLDEATSALDSESETLVQQAINRLAKDRTSIIIAHRLSTIQNSDLIYVLDNKTIVEEGTHNDLMSKDSIYKKLYEVQFCQ